MVNAILAFQLGRARTSRVLPRQPQKYRKHRAPCQAIVTLDGRHFYLGPHGTRASHREYDRLIGEWIQNGRRLPAEHQKALTITELAARYWRFAVGYYQKNGRPTNVTPGIKVALQFLKELCSYRKAV